jgi:hypothetical protein
MSWATPLRQFIPEELFSMYTDNKTHVEYFLLPPVNSASKFLTLFSFFTRLIRSLHTAGSLKILANTLPHMAPFREDPSILANALLAYNTFSVDAKEQQNIPTPTLSAIPAQRSFIKTPW